MPAWIGGIFSLSMAAARYIQTGHSAWGESQLSRLSLRNSQFLPPLNSRIETRDCAGHDMPLGRDSYFCLSGTVTRIRIRLA